MNRIISIALLIPIIVAGWYFFSRNPASKSHGGDSQEIPAATSHHVESSGLGSRKAEIERSPEKNNFDGLKTDVTGVTNEGDWLERYPAEQAEIIRKFSMKYMDVYDIKGPGQIAWMQEHGYVMPDDIIASLNMSIDDLRKLSDQGDNKATMLLYDRILDAYVEKRDAFISAGGGDTYNFNITEGHELASETMDINRKLDQMDSPFVFFLDMRNGEFSDQSFVDKEANILGSLLAAQYSGDSRGFMFIDNCVANGSCTSDGVNIALATARNMILTNMRQAAPLNYRVPRYAPMPSQ